MSKLNAAESIRGLACIAVVFSHLSLTFYPYLHHFTPEDQPFGVWDSFLHHSPFAFLYSGTAAVFVFFVLSGYVLSYAILSKPDVLKKVGEMTLKRYPRLAIPTLGSCLLCWCGFKFFTISTEQVNGWFQAYAPQNLSFSQALYEGTLGAFFASKNSSNWVLWTMRIELLGSLIIFLLCVIKVWNKYLFYIVGLIFLVLFPFKTGTLFLGLFSFVIGLYIYLYTKKISNISAICLLLIGLYLGGAHNDSYSYIWIYKLLGSNTYQYCNFFAGILIVYSILQNNSLGRWLDKKSLVYLGKLSFSIYLLHLILLYLICVPIFNFFLLKNFSFNEAVCFSTIIFFCFLFMIAHIYSQYVDQFAIKASTLFSKYIQGLFSKK